MNEKTKIQWRPIGEVHPYPNNPRNNDDAVEYVANSIRQFGWQQPIVVDTDSTIIAGHTRLKAAKRLGMETVPVVVADNLTPAQVNAYRLADNKVAEAATWDMDALSIELEGLEVDFDMTMFDFDESEFDFGGSDSEQAEIAEVEIPEDVPSLVRLGDVWQLGRHRLMCGDSTESDSVKILMNGSTADLAFQSPPYNIGKNAKLNDRVDENKYLSYVDDNPEYKQLLYLTTENALSNASYVAVNIQALSGNKRIFAQWLADFKELLCDIAVWYKDNAAPAMARRVMNSSFEFVIFFSKESQTRAIGTNDFRGTVSNVYQSHVQNKNEYSKVHSATFPIEFVANYIGNFTNKNDSILDLFGGTGTTLIAAEQLGRTCYMMELDPSYCDIIIERWQNLTGETAHKVEQDG